MVTINLRTRAMMSSSRFDIVEISDIHFGNGKVNPEIIYTHLQKYLYPELKDINLFVINGDTFDTLLNMNSIAGWYVARFIDDVITMAVENKFYVRVVRGTFSHDRNQNQFFQVRGKDQLTLNGKQLVKVYNSLEIENFGKHNFLFCPDNLPYKDLTQEIINKLEINHLKTIDGIFSHGYYNHLLPDNLPHVPTDTIYWEKIKPHISGYCLNGHVHHMGVHDNVISSGSFERMDHGVTEKVGFWKLTFDKKWIPSFVENKGSLAFKTFYTEESDTDESIKNRMIEYIDNLYKEGYDADCPIYIRLAGKDNGILQIIKEKYPSVVPSVKATKTIQEDPLTNASLYEELPDITEENLPDLIYQQLKSKNIFSEKEIKELINAL